MTKLFGKRGKNGIYDISLDEKIFKFPSVTTILSKLKDEGLEKLRNEVGDKELSKISKNATNRGTIMHAYLENFSIAFKKSKNKNKSLLYSQKKTQKDFKNFTESENEKGLDLFYNLFHSPFIDEFKIPLLIEGLMVSFKYKYAGRTDIIYIDNNKELVLGDFKSSNSLITNDSFKIVKYKLQLAAYINAFEEIYKKQIKYGAIWVGYTHGYQKIILSKHEYPIYFNFFRDLIKQ